MADNFSVSKDNSSEPSKGVKQLTKKIAKGGGIVFFGNIIQKGLGFLLQVLLGNFLGPSIYGLYSLGSSMIDVSGQASMLGLSNGIIRFIPVYKGEKAQSKIKGALISTLGFSTAFAVIISIILFILSDQIAVIIFHEPGLSETIKGFSISLPFYVFMFVSSSCVQGFQRMEHYTGIMLARPVINIAAVAASFFLGFRLYGAIFGFIISAFLSAVLGFYFLKKNFPDFLSKLKPVFEIRKLLRFSLPVYIAGFSWILLSRTDIFMLGYFMESANVGIYRAAVSLATLVNFALISFNMAFAPMISDLYSQKKLKELEVIFKTVTRWVFLLSLVVALLMALFSKNLLTIFGSGFSVGWLVLIVLAVSRLISVGVGSVGFMLQMSGHQDLILINNVSIVVLNVVLNIWLIPIYGILGAAIATGISLVLDNIVGLIEVRVLLKFHPWDRKYIKVLLAGLISAAFFPLFNLVNIYWYVNMICLGVIYFVSFYLLGLTNEDKLIVSALKKKLFSRRR